MARVVEGVFWVAQPPQSDGISEGIRDSGRAARELGRDGGQSFPEEHPGPPGLGRLEYGVISRRTPSL